MLKKGKQFQVSEAIPEDIPSIMEVQRAGWLTTYINEDYGITAKDIMAKDFTSQKRMERWTKTLLEKKDTVKMLVAKDGDKIVAFISVEKAEKTNKLGAVYVLPEYQGQGVGKMLMEQGMTWLGSDKDVVLDVVTYNNKAITIYAKMGFEKADETPAQDLAKLPSGKIMPEMRMIKRRNMSST